MTIYLSMIVWIPIVYFFYSHMNNDQPVAQANKNCGMTTKSKNATPIWVCILIFGYFIFWIGLRGYIADTGTDIFVFNSIPNNFSDAWKNIEWDGRGPGYEVLAVLFKSFVSKDATIWLMTVASISGICIVVGLRRYSSNFFYSSYLFMTLLIFYWMINGMRQFLCVAILFAFSHWIEKGKIIKLLILTFLLYFVHVTAVMIIPLYFIARGKPWSYKTFFLIVFIAVASLYSDSIFKNAESVFGGVAYQGYTEQFKEDDGVNILRVLFTALFPVLALWRRRVLEEHYADVPILPICINMSLATSAVFFIGIFTSGVLVGRLPVYSEVYNMILIPYLIKYGFSEKEQRILYPLLTIVLFIFFYLKIPHYYHSDVLDITSYELFS